MRLIAIAAFLLFSLPAHADCVEPQPGSDKAAMFSPPLAEVVVGSGRLQFYSAPSKDCAMPGVFVIPKDSLIAYADCSPSAPLRQIEGLHGGRISGSS